jgi:serine/threonine-protein phosphatase 5
MSAEAVDALKQKGNDFFGKKEYDEAIEAYSEALALDPTNAVILCNRAICYIRTEKYGAALEDANKAIEKDASNPKAYYRRGAANMSLLKHKAALEDFRTVVKLCPQDPVAKQKLSICEKEVRRIAFEEAIESEQTKALWESFDPKSIRIEPEYAGPRTCATMEDALAIAEFQRGEKRVHKALVCDMLIRARVLFMSLPSLVDVTVPAGRRITVCGDTHGQYYDLLNIFEKNGWPSRENPYLFNGDFVDRGSFSTEVILLLLAFKLADPDCLHLTRGNHESRNLNRAYGFEGEVLAKYNQTVYMLFQEVFCVFPLAIVLNKQVFVVHGGLPSQEGVTLDDIRAIRRDGDIPDSGIMCDLLWADPFPGNGRIASKRGVGMQFGADVTESFLRENGLSLLVRSHEVKERGYEEMHNGKCITIFSAPNYCDQMGNMGAYIHFTADASGKLSKDFVQFQCVPHPNVRPMAYSNMSQLM